MGRVNSVINEATEQMFRGIMAGQRLPVRQIPIAIYNLEQLDTHPTLWGRTHEERWGAVDDVVQRLNEQLGKTAVNPTVPQNAGDRRPSHLKFACGIGIVRQSKISSLSTATMRTNQRSFPAQTPTLRQAN